MQTVEEFMQKYFAEQTDLDRAAIARSVSFRERFFTAEFVAEVGRSIEQDKVYEKTNPSKVESIEVADSAAKVVALETRVGSSQRRIYYLKASNDGWQIDRKGMECFNCDGSGIYDGKVCFRCNGEGWALYGASDR
jgi:hypothetical protein